MTLLDDYKLAEPTVRKLYDSGLRLAILDALSKGPLRLADLRREVNSNAPNTSSKAKELEDMGLIEREGGDYKLTVWGQAARMQTKKTLDFYCAREKLRGFWDSRIIEGLPEDLWEDIGALKDAETMDIQMGSQTEPNDRFVRMLRSIDKEFLGISPILHKEYPLAVEHLVNKGADAKCIVNAETAKVLLEQTPKKTLRTILASPNSKLYLYKGELKLALVVSEKFMCFSLAAKASPRLFTDSILCSTSPEARAWGKRLFDHYIKNCEVIDPAKYGL